MLFFLFLNVNLFVAIKQTHYNNSDFYKDKVKKVLSEILEQDKQFIYNQ